MGAVYLLVLKWIHGVPEDFIVWYFEMFEHLRFKGETLFTLAVVRIVHAHTCINFQGSFGLSELHSSSESALQLVCDSPSWYPIEALEVGRIERYRASRAEFALPSRLLQPLQREIRPPRQTSGVNISNVE